MIILLTRKGFSNSNIPEPDKKVVVVVSNIGYIDETNTGNAILTTNCGILEVKETLVEVHQKITDLLI